MTQTQAIIARAPRTRQDRENPLSLFISVIRETPKGNQITHSRKLRNLLLSDGYEEFLDAVIDEWQRIKYTTALKAAVPPSTAEIKKRAAAKKALAEKEEAAVEKAKALIGERIFYTIMPNGKPLHECTGAECVKFGNHFAKIGKHVGPRRVVGKVMSAADITALLDTKGR